MAYGLTLDDHCNHRPDSCGHRGSDQTEYGIWSDHYYRVVCHRPCDLSVPSAQPLQHDLPGTRPFLLIFWTIGLIASFADIKFLADERPQQTRTALIGLPMLLLFIVDIFWQFPAPYDVAALWGVSLLTGLLALIAVRLFLHFKDRKPAGACRIISHSLGDFHIFLFSRPSAEGDTDPCNSLVHHQYHEDTSVITHAFDIRIAK